MRTKLAVLSLLLVMSCLTSALKPATVFSLKTISVPNDFPSIQLAVDNAIEGDIVFVHEGIYWENLVVNKSIALVGENSNATFVNGHDIAPTITVTADNASVTGFTIENGGSTATGAGILVSGVQYVNVSYNVVISSYSGVRLVNSSLNVVQNNFISLCNSGLYLDTSNSNLIAENTVSNTSSSGVYLQSSSENRVSGNTVTANDEYGLRIEASPNCLIERNSVSQNAGDGLRVFSSANCMIDENNIGSNAIGALVQDSTNVSLTGNAVEENREDGIYISNSQSSKVQTNDVSKNNGSGLYFQFADFSIASDNYVGNNTQGGVSFYTCIGVQAISNNVEYNGAGFSLQYCPNSTVSENEVQGNTRKGLSVTNSGGSVFSANSILKNGEGGLEFQNSTSSIVEESIVCNNARYGIWLQDSPNVEVIRCNASLNGLAGGGWDGIYVSNSNGSRIINSSMNGNSDAGSRLFYTHNVTLVGNSFSENGDGLRIFNSDNNTVNANIMSLNLRGINVVDSTGNLIYNNIFLDNSANVASRNSVNTWNIGYTDGGNYWSNYNGTDTQWGADQNEAGRDGIGDQPYVIDQENEDRYPLVLQFRVHDLAFEHVSSTPDEVYPGWIFETEMTVTNIGGYVETFNLTSYLSDQMIETHVVNNLTVGASYQVTLTWNTSSFRPCTTSEVVIKISRDQNGELAGNDTYNLGFMKTKILGDVNADGKVDIFDVRIIDAKFGSKSPETLWRLSCDMNNDGVINILDIGLAARNCGSACS